MYLPNLLCLDIVLHPYYKDEPDEQCADRANQHLHFIHVVEPCENLLETYE